MYKNLYQELGYGMVRLLRGYILFLFFTFGENEKSMIELEDLFHTEEKEAKKIQLI